MKKGFVLTVMLAGVLVLGYSQNAISGTYRYSTNAYITFTGSSFTGSWNATSTMSGTFSVSGSRLTLNITGGTRAPNTWNWTIVDVNTLRDQDGDSWKKESGGIQGTSMQNARQLQFDSQQTLNIARGDVHWFFVRSTESASVTVGTTGGLDTMITAFNESNNQIAEDDDSGEGSNARLTIQLEPNRQVYLRVRLYDSSGSGNYTISTQVRTAATTAYDRGMAFNSNSNYVLAIEAFNEAIRLNPNYAEAYVGRGQAYRDIKDNDRAMTDFGRAIQINPNYSEAYAYRGYVYLDKGDYDQAIADFNTAIRSLPDWTWLYSYRGDAYRQKGDYDRAIADFSTAIRSFPDWTFLYSYRGDAYRQKGDYDRAIADCNEAIRLGASDWASVYECRGLAYEKKGNFSSALTDFITTLRLDAYNYTNAQENLERILASASIPAGAHVLWAVNNAATWIEAVNGIRNGGNNKVHTITISGTVSVPMSDSITFGSITNIVVKLEGNGTISPSSNGSLLYVGDGQTVTVKDITLKGRESNSNNSVVRIEKGTFRMQGSSSVTGNVVNGGDVGGVYVDSGIFIMMGNASVTGNTAGGVYVNSGVFTMLGSASVSGNKAGTGVHVRRYGYFYMDDNAAVSGNTVESSGGGVYNYQGTFTMNGNAAVSGNTASSGGGVYNYQGTFTMNGNASVSGNTASYDGGGVYFRYTTFTMNDSSTITGNTASSGGGVYNYQGTFTMNGNASVSGNKGRHGGGVGVLDGTFTMLDSTSVLGNTASEAGGGVVNSGTFTMNGNASVSGNKGSIGGGVCISGGKFYIYGNTIISGNTAEGDGGGVYGETFTKTGGTIYGNDAAPELRNTATTGKGHVVYNGRWRNSTAGPTMNSDTYGFWLND
jgi:tetratricopeptide (TPR) repeat protein